MYYATAGIAHSLLLNCFSKQYRIFEQKEFIKSQCSAHYPFAKLQRSKTGYDTIPAKRWLKSC